MIKKREYCNCDNCESVWIDDDEWGYWNVCCKCNKEIEGTYVSYNHYDGKDNDFDPYEE